MPLRHIAGHRHLLERLAQAIERGTLPPSLIFSGPEGVGKRTAAIALAQALNCERPVPWPDSAPDESGAPGASGTDGCGECGACRRIARGVHADLLMIAPGDSGSIKVDQIREAIDRSSYRPFEGRRRVVIVDEADALMRHFLERDAVDTDGVPHCVKVFWRAGAMAQKWLEKRNQQSDGAK